MVKKQILVAALFCGIVCSNSGSVEAANQQQDLTATQAYTVNVAADAEIQELGWTHIRRKIFGGKRKDDDGYRPPPPPPRYPPPPHHYPPPPPRHQPPPPPPHRQPPPPPPRHYATQDLEIMPMVDVGDSTDTIS